VWKDEDRFKPRPTEKTRVFMALNESLRLTQIGCAFLGFLCLLIAVPCQEWTAVRADTSARATVSVLPRPYYNAKNDYDWYDTMTSFGLFEIHCESESKAGCSPDNPFGYAPPEPISPWHAEKKAQFSIAQFCDAENPNKPQFYRLGGTFPYWLGDTSSAQARVRTAFCGGVWATPRAFSIIYIIVAAYNLLILLGEPEAFFWRNDLGFLLLQSFLVVCAIICIACWTFIHSLLVDAFPWMSVELGFSFILCVLALAFNCILIGCAVVTRCSNDDRRVDGAPQGRRRRDPRAHKVNAHMSEMTAVGPPREASSHEAVLGEPEPMMTLPLSSLFTAAPLEIAKVDDSTVSGGCDACVGGTDAMDDQDDASNSD
jgi:hypothetical protein